MRGVIFYNQSNNNSIWGDISAWTSSLEKMGWDFYIAIDIDNEVPNWVETKNIEGYRVSNMDEALSKLDSIHSVCETVYLTMDSNVLLQEWPEPENVCYICGPDNGTNPVINADYDIKIDALNLWAIECISIIYGRNL